MSNLFDSVLKEVPEEISNYIDISFEIVDQIHEILESKGKTQKDLAEMLGKSESEISKWMRGTHNFTIKSIAKIEAVLGEKIIITPERVKKEIISIITDTFKTSLNKNENRLIFEEIENNSFISHGLSCSLLISPSNTSLIQQEDFMLESYAMVA
ncbi:MAG: helix-turn-helix transcriptional regulator [Cytophagales bacterium]